MTENWYRALIADPDEAARCLRHDYGEIASLLKSMTGLVLDIGGGVGIVRQYLPPESDLLVIEPSLMWLEPAWSSLAHRFPALAGPLNVVRAVGEHLPVRTNSFDAALALWTLNHVRDPHRVILEAHRVLKPGGRLLLVLEGMIPNAEDIAAHPDLVRLLERGIQAPPRSTSESELGAALAGRFVVAQRTWATNYLVFDLARIQEVSPRLADETAVAEKFLKYGNPAIDSATTASTGQKHITHQRQTNLPLLRPVERTPMPSRTAVLASLAWTLIRTDLKLRYHGSIGGFTWALLRPLSIFLVLLAVFSLIFQATPDYALNLIIGLFLWDFFAESTRSGLMSLAAKGHLLTKVKLPSWVLVFTSASNALLTLGLFTLILVGALLVSGRSVTLGHVGLFGLYVVLFLAIIVGFSLAASVLFLRYRDLNQVWDLAIQAGFFAAPIIYPLSILPERLHFYLYLWPPTPVIQFTRSLFVEGTIPTARAHAFLVLEAAIVIAVGIAVFRYASPKAAEYV